MASRGDGPTRTETKRSAPAMTPDAVVVAVLSGPQKGSVVRLPGAVGKAITVGTSRECDLVVKDSTVSRRHLELLRTEQGILVRDLGSKNGVRVAGVRVKEAVVEAGTVLAAGDTELIVRVELEGAVVAPSPSERFGLARGKSLSIRRVFGVLERFAPTSATIVLTGETGTGKDVLARSIHIGSPRSRGPFEVVDCGAISPALVESELFGHEKGSFTGATSSHQGAFERAHGGTLFLDEIGELPIGLQPKLLRALEAREIRRVGGSKVLRVDVRIVAATTRDLVAEVERGGFRQDLYFRLAVVPVHVPPLRSRSEDIAIIAEELLRPPSFPEALTLSARALASLRSHAWPGNVRELRNVLDRAAFLALAAGSTVIDDVPLEPARVSSSGPGPLAFAEGVTYREARSRVASDFEERYVRWLLERHAGNISAAAREAKMDRKYLGTLARKYGLRDDDG